MEPQLETFIQAATVRFLSGKPFQTHSKDRRPCLGWMRWAAQTARGQGQRTSLTAPRHLKPQMTGCHPTAGGCEGRGWSLKRKLAGSEERRGSCHHSGDIPSR